MWGKNNNVKIQFQASGSPASTPKTVIAAPSKTATATTPSATASAVSKPTTINDKAISQMNCEMMYIPGFIPKKDTKYLYDLFLRTFDLERRMVEVTNHKGETVEYKLNRETCVFGENEDDLDVIPKLWGKNVKLHKWTPELAKIKENIEKATGAKYNICLVNYYENGDRNIGFHSDREEQGSTANIASISLGTERKFTFRNKQDRSVTHDYLLEDGSLVVMGKNCQERYEHALVPDKAIKTGRVNLTFRLFSRERYSSY